MVHDGCNYFSFWATFCPFTPLTAQKKKNLKKWKKHMEISSFYISIPKIIIRWCTVSEIWCMADVIIFDFGPFFGLLLPKQLKKSKIRKSENMPGDIIILHMCTKRWCMVRWCMVGWSDDVWFLRYGVWHLIVISHFRLYFALLHP